MKVSFSVFVLAALICSVLACKVMPGHEANCPMGQGFGPGPRMHRHRFIEEPMIEPMPLIEPDFAYGRYGHGRPSPLREFSFMVGVSLPFGPEFRQCFRSSGIELSKQLKLAGRAATDDLALDTIRKALARASTSLESCGAADMASFFTVVLSELDPQTMSALVRDVIAIVRDAKNGDWNSVASDLADALRYAVPLIRCSSDACRIFANILRVLQIEASDFTACRSDIETFLTAANSLAHIPTHPLDVDAAIDALRSLLGAVSGAGEACGLAQAADIFSVQAGKLIRAVEEKVSNGVRVVVEGLDVTEDIVDIISNFGDHQWSAAGAALAKLTADLRLATCQDKWCAVAEAFLDASSVIFRDLTACKAELKTAFTQFDAAEGHWKAADYGAAVTSFARGTVTLGDAVTTCGVPELAGIVALAGERLGNAEIRRAGEAVEVIVHGVDVFVDIGEIVEDLAEGHWADAGREINRLLQDVSSFKCESEFCRAAEAALRVLGIFLPDVPMCEADAEGIAAALRTAGTAWEAGDYAGALRAVAEGLDTFAHGLTDCGLDKVARVVLAEVAKLTNNPHVEEVGDGIVRIIVAGADVYDSIYGVVVAFETGNWHGVGAALARLVRDLSTLGCTSDACRAFEGILRVISDVYVDLAPCEDEMKTAWSSIELAMGRAAAGDASGAAAAAGEALLDTAHAIHTCHLDYVAADIVVVAQLLHMAHVEKNAEGVIDFIVGGLSIIDDVHLLIDDYHRGDMGAVGRDIGDIIAQVRALLHRDCGAEGDAMCLMSNAFLMGFNVLPNLKECAGDFVAAYNELLKAMHYAGKGDWKKATIDVGKTVHLFAEGMNACDVPEIVDVLTKVAEMLLGPEVAIVGQIFHILVDGIEIADDVYDIYVDYEAKDYLKMGIDLARLVELLL